MKSGQERKLKQRRKPLTKVLSPESKIECILFDLDGTLVESRDMHFDSLNKALKKCGEKEISEKDHKSIFNGLSTKQKCEKLGLSEKVTSKVFNLKQKFTLDFIEKKLAFDVGKLRLINRLLSDGYIVGVVTNCVRETAQAMLSKIGILHLLDILITNEDVSYKKPHSEPYVLAMVEMGVLPSRVLVVEDGIYGIQAAESIPVAVMKVTSPEEVNIPSIYKVLNREVPEDNK